jgi:hypothetical protein
MSDWVESLVFVGDGEWEADKDLPLWSETPTSVKFEVTGAPEAPSSAVVQLLADVERLLPQLWPKMVDELIAMTGYEDKWKVLSRLDTLSVHVTEGSARWTVQIGFSGRLADTSFFIDVEGGEIVGADAAD